MAAQTPSENEPTPFPLVPRKQNLSPDQHRCPTCNHICFQSTSKHKPTGRKVGRPATFWLQVLTVLREYASPENTTAAREIAARLGVEGNKVSGCLAQAKRRGEPVMTRGHGPFARVYWGGEESGGD
jgi:hypothetical protein